MVRASRVVLVVSPVTGALVAALFWVVAALSFPASVWTFILLPYWIGIGLAVGAVAGVVTYLTVRSNPQRLSDGSTIFPTALAASLATWLLAYPLFFLRQTEYSPIVLSVLPALLCGTVVSLVLRTRLPRSESIASVEPETGTGRAVGIRATLVPVGALVLVALLALCALGFVTGILVPIRLSGQDLGSSLQLLSSESATDIVLRLIFVSFWAVASVGLGIWRITRRARVPISEVLSIVLLVEGLILAHTWWLASAVSGALFWRDPDFNAVPDPNPYSELLWALEIVAWISILIASIVMMKSLLSRR